MKFSHAVGATVLKNCEPLVFAPAFPPPAGRAYRIPAQGSAHGRSCSPGHQRLRRDDGDTIKRRSGLRASRGSVHSPVPPAKPVKLRIVFGGLGREEIDVDIARVGVVWRVAVVVIGGRLGP